jgi:hypothetical protein
MTTTTTNDRVSNPLVTTRTAGLGDCEEEGMGDCQ